jgi:PhnB protein
MADQLNETGVVFFAPMLYFSNVAAAMYFYRKAFDAKELRRWSNDDGSVHVGEMRIGNALFHLHEEVAASDELSPENLGGTPVVIGLFVDDPAAVAAKAIEAGATETSPVTDYDYGYRQVSITDPFGHHWTIERKISGK